jgi:hypothetical protein
MPRIQNLLPIKAFEVALISRLSVKIMPLEVVRIASVARAKEIL